MKKINKLSILFLVCCAGTYAFAQNIELPEVTTVIEGDSIKAGLDTLPDFNDVLVVDGDSGKVVPKLPEVEEPEDTSNASVGGEVAEKTIFAEGLIGGGYPTLFKGNFSVFRMTGESPFKLEFDYNSANGYTNHALTDGFYDRNTKLLVEKNYKKDKLGWGINGLYQASNDGLQNRIEGISSLNHEIYNADGNVSYELGKGFTLGSEFAINFYNRYADVTKGTFPAATVMEMKPELFINWKGSSASAFFNAEYLLEVDTKNEISSEKLHRGEFTLGGDWSTDYIKIFGNAAAVVGNYIGNNSVVVPFTVGVDTIIPVPFSSRKITAGVSGGIKSDYTSLCVTENKYKFTSSTFILPETSDWYGKLAVTIPVGDGFTGNFEFEYLQTAFGNNVFAPEYALVSSYGTYDFVGKDNRQANTKLALSYHYKFITVTGMWQSYWLNVPVLETQNAVGLDINFQDEKARWGADLTAKFFLGEQEIVPLINLEGFVRITSAVRAVVSVEDLVELMKAEQRVYAGQYIGRGGSASAMLKFFF